MPILLIFTELGGSGGLVISACSFYSDDLGSNSADYQFDFLKLLYKKTKINEKEAGVGPFLLKKICTENILT